MRVIIKKLYFILLLLVISCSVPLFSQCMVLQDGLQKESINNFVRRNERFKQRYLYVPVYHESKFETKPSHKQKYFPIIKKRKAAVSFLKHNGYDLDKGGSSTILPWMRTKIYYLQSQGGIYLQQDFCVGQYQHVRNESCPFLDTEACLYKYNCNKYEYILN